MAILMCPPVVSFRSKKWSLMIGYRFRVGTVTVQAEV